MKKVIVIILLILGLNSASELGWFGDNKNKIDRTVTTSVETQKSDTLMVK